MKQIKHISLLHADTKDEENTARILADISLPKLSYHTSIELVC